MKPNKSLFSPISKAAGLVLLTSFCITLNLQGANYQWDTNGAAAGLGGTGNWTTTDANWDLSGTGLDDGTDATQAVTFATTDTAAFGGTAGTVTLASAVALGTTSFTSPGYVVNLTDTAGVNYAFGALSGAPTINVSLGAGAVTSGFAAATDFSAFTGTLNIGVAQAAGAGKSAFSNPTGALPAAATVNLTANSSLYLAVPLAHAAAITLNGGDTGESLGQLRLDTGSWSGPVTLAGSITGANDGYIGGNTGVGTISGNIGETGGSKVLSKVGNGTVVLAGTNTFTGATTVGGPLHLDYATNNTSKLSDTAGVTLNGGAILRFIGNGAAPTTELVNGLTLNGNASVALNTAAGQTLTADFTGSGSGVFTPGAFTLDVVASGTGTARVKLPGTTANTALLPGVTYNGLAAGTDANNFLKTNSVVNNTATDLGTWVSGATQYGTTGAAFTGAVGTIAIDGIIFTDNAARIVAIGTGNTVTVNQGVTVTSAVGNFVSTLSGGSIQGPAAGPLVLNNTNTANNLTIASVIANNGVGTVSKTGPGVLALSGANTFAGGLTIQQGRVNAIAAGVLGTGAITAGLNSNYGTAYASAGAPFLAVTATGNQVVANNLVLPDAPTLRYYAIQKSDNTSSLELGGTISGGGANTVLQLDTPNSGDSTTLHILSGNNTLAGQVRLNRGAVALTNANALGTAALFTQSNVNAANGNIRFTNSFTLPNNIIIGTTNNQTFNTNANDVVLSGVFSGVGSWSKIGTGTLTLTGVNTLAGATNVNAGTVAGTGSATSALNVAATATLSPGVGVGTWLSAAATFVSGSIFKAELNSTTTTADKLQATGIVTLGGATLTLSDLGSTILSNGTKLTLIDYTGGSLTGTFASLAEGATVTVGTNTYLISYVDGSKVTLTAQLTGGYNNWAIANAGGQAANLDFDNDGVRNGVEYFMGQTGAGFTPSPTVVGGKVTWAKDPTAFATYVVQTSSDLVTWNPALTGVQDIGTAVTYTLPTGAGKLFVRLRVNAP